MSGQPPGAPPTYPPPGAPPVYPPPAQSGTPTGYPPATQPGAAPPSYPPPGYPPGGHGPPPAPSSRLGGLVIVLVIVGVIVGLAFVGLILALLLRVGPAVDPQPDQPPSGVLEPVPVGTIPPGGGPPPDPGPGEPTPLPPTADEVVLAGGVATVPVPQGWRVFSQSADGTQVELGDGRGVYVWAAVFNADPSQSAAQLLAQNLNALIGAERFGQLRVGEVAPLQPVGGMVSFAAVAYSGLWTDSQSSVEIEGNLWLGVRQDGSVLAITANSPSRPQIEATAAEFGVVWTGSYRSFAGTS